MLIFEWATIKTLWCRDMLRLLKEQTRWIGVVIHPLLVWLVIGYGIQTSYSTDQGISYLKYFFPGIIVMSILFTTIYATMSIIEDRASGFLQAVMVAPGSNCALIIGKIFGVTSIGLIQVIIFCAIAPWAGFSWSEISWFSLFITSLMSLVALTAMNFSFAWALNSTQGYHAIMSVLLIPLWMLSGAIFPSGPAWLTFFMKFNPLYYVVQGIRNSLLGHPLISIEIYQPLLILSCFGVLMFCGATKVMKRSLRT
jgi:ABC-2 type transport system permease protein